VLEIDGIFGIYDMPSGPYVALIMESELMFEDAATGIDFRQATRIGLLPILSATAAAAAAAQLPRATALAERRVLRLLQWALHSHTLLFSHHHHVTHSMQRCAELAQAYAQVGGASGGVGNNGAGGAAASDGEGGLGSGHQLRALHMNWRQADQR
jgi:SacI homology domain